MKILLQLLTETEKVGAVIVPGVPGLAVTEGVGPNEFLYAVTHTHSGLAVLHRPTEDDALTTLMDLAILGEWDVPANKFSRSLRKRARAMIVERDCARSRIHVPPKGHPSLSRRLPR